MSEMLKDYFEALERLKSGKPVIMPKGTKITNDSVSLEAGRKKGTIKKSRQIFAELIKAIDDTTINSLGRNGSRVSPGSRAGPRFRRPRR